MHHAQAAHEEQHTTRRGKHQEETEMRHAQDLPDLTKVSTARAPNIATDDRTQKTKIGLRLSAIGFRPKAHAGGEPFSHAFLVSQPRADRREPTAELRGMYEANGGCPGAAGRGGRLRRNQSG